MQKSFSDLEYAAKRKTTRYERFPAELERITPWPELIGLEKMLLMYIVQQSLGLSNEGSEDALYDNPAIRQFVGLDLGRESAPDATTLLKLRHLFEEHKLTESIFATIIAAPSSSENQKGKQWHFGVKAHIGVDANSGPVHTVIVTAANVSDVTLTQALLHGNEQEGFGDAGYQGAGKRPEAEGKMRRNIALRPCKRRALDLSQEIDRLRDQLETLKARIRAKVEHPFHIIKNSFGLKKVRYRRLAENTAQLMTLFGLANLMIAKRRLLQFSLQGAS